MALDTKTTVVGDALIGAGAPEVDGTDSPMIDDRNLLEALLRCLQASGDCRADAGKLLDRFGSLTAVLDASPEDLRSAGLEDRTVRGVSIVRALAERRQFRHTDSLDLASRPDGLHALWQFRLGHLQHEVFEVALLDAGSRLLPDGVMRLSTGTVDRAVIFPRQVVVAALRREACGIVLAHNHPNGRVEPSERDRLLTRSMVLAAETVDLRLIDHVIVSSSSIFSFRAAGML